MDSTQLTIHNLEGTTLTRMFGRPTLRNVNKTRNEITAAYAQNKTKHPDFPSGERFGFASAIMKQKRFITLHNKTVQPGDDGWLDEEWEFEYPSRPSAYDSTITGQMLDATRRRKEEERKALLEGWDTFNAYELSYKTKLAAAYDEPYWATLKHDILGFSHLTVHQMIEHLERQCLALTNREKKKKHALNSLI